MHSAQFIFTLTLTSFPVSVTISWFCHHHVSLWKWCSRWCLVSIFQHTTHLLCKSESSNLFKFIWPKHHLPHVCLWKTINLFFTLLFLLFGWLLKVNGCSEILFRAFRVKRSECKCMVHFWKHLSVNKQTNKKTDNHISFFFHFTNFHYFVLVKYTKLKQNTVRYVAVM